MFVNQLPTDIKDCELLKSMTLKQLLDLRATSKEWNARVLQFLKIVWLPHKKAQLDDIGGEIEAIYNGILPQVNAATINSRDPGLRIAIKTLQPKLNDALKLVGTMLNVMENVLHLNFFTLRSGTKISQADLILWQSKLNQYKEKLMGILRRMDPEYESEMEMELYFQEIEHMAGRKKQMTADQKRQILAAIDECLRSKEHTSGARRSTLQTHQEGKVRRRQDKWRRAQRVFEQNGFAAALSDAERC